MKDLSTIASMLSLIMSTIAMWNGEMDFAILFLGYAIYFKLGSMNKI